MTIPDDLKYARSHEWIKTEGDSVVVGISHYAQDQLGEVVYVELPEVGTAFAVGDELGSLEFGVAVPNRADPWTRMSYAGPNKPVAPITDPEQMLGRLYGQMKNKENNKQV